MRYQITKEVRLAALEMSLEKFGNFLEELSVLILVFVPLDIWQGKLTLRHLIEIGCSSGGLFLIGLGCHWVLLIVKTSQKGIRK